MTELVSAKQIKKKDTDESCLTFINKVTGAEQKPAKDSSRLKLWEKRKRVA